MRSKAPLILMEQLVMVLVFALAAALCLQAFVFADRTSRTNEARDRAMVEAQNAAEMLKAGRETEYLADMLGAANGNAGMVIDFNGEWEPVEAGSADAAYHLLTFPAGTESAYLWAADVLVFTAGGDLLVSLPVAGQNGGEGADRYG